MRNAVFLILAGVLLIVLIGVGAAYAMPKTAPPAASSAPAQQSAPQRDPQQYPYLLRAYEGKLAVFTEDLVNPELVFDVYVKTLPEYDQQALARGVRVESYEKLTALIEDYIS